MQAILAAFRNWYFRAIGAHSVDGILADFDKKFSQLHAAAKFHDAQECLHDKKVAEHIGLASRALQEAQRARLVADRIKSLIHA